MSNKNKDLNEIGMSKQAMGQNPEWPKYAPYGQDRGWKRHRRTQYKKVEPEFTCDYEWEGDTRYDHRGPR
jgi:hypothetical protein